MTNGQNGSTDGEGQNVFKYDKELSGGWFSKPHGLMTMLQEKRLTKCEYLLLDYLLAYENRHKTESGWFFRCDSEIAVTRLLSSKKIVEARRGLKKKELIDVRKGHSHHATDYLILIPIKYYS